MRRHGVLETCVWDDEYLGKGGSGIIILSLPFFSRDDQLPYLFRIIRNLRGW